MKFFFTYMQHVDSGEGGGVNKKKKTPTIFQKLNQVNSNMATPSTFQQDFVFLYSLNSTGL